MTYYNPFEKTIGEQLTIDDLQGLINKGVAEGFYIEYKSEFVPPQKIERSLSSFANTYGGWYFVGIEADSENRAIGLCGVDHTTGDPLLKIMDPARQRLSHMPLMFPQLVRINNTHSVVAVFVPEGDETPYITSGGRIYRRAADASDPVYEKDRYTIDRLVDRGREDRERFKQFSQDERTFSLAEENSVWLHVYFQPRPRNWLTISNLLSADSIQGLVENSRKNLKLRISSENDATMGGNVPFDIGYSSQRSVILRQTRYTSVGFNSLSMQLFTDGSAKIYVPIKVVNPLEPPFEIPKVNQILKDFYSNTYETHAIANFVDFGNSAVTCAFLIEYYLNWLESQKWTTDLWMNISVTNIWRMVPVIDSIEWAEWIDKTGFPISMNDYSSTADQDQPLTCEFGDHETLWLQAVGIAAASTGITFDKFAEFFTNFIWRRAGNTE